MNHIRTVLTGRVGSSAAGTTARTSGKGESSASNGRISFASPSSMKPSSLLALVRYQHPHSPLELLRVADLLSLGRILGSATLPSVSTSAMIVPGGREAIFSVSILCSIGDTSGDERDLKGTGRRMRTGGRTGRPRSSFLEATGNQSNVSDASTGLPVGQKASISWGMADSSRLHRLVRGLCRQRISVVGIF